MLIRQTMMNEAVELRYLPEEVLTGLGINFQVGGEFMPVWAHLLVLVASLLLFYGLAILVVSRKKGKV